MKKKKCLDYLLVNVVENRLGAEKNEEEYLAWKIVT